MQTKKRAKPVKFGKAAVAEAKKEEVKETTELTDLKEVIKQAVREEIEEVAAEEERTTSKKLYIDETVTEPVHHEPHEEIKEVSEISEQEKEENQEVEQEEKPSSKEEVVVKEAEAVLAANEEESSDEVEETDDSSKITRSRLADADYDSPFGSDEPPATVEKKKNHFLYFLMVALITFVLGLAFIVGGYYALQNKNISLSEVTQLIGMGDTPTPEPTEKPKATPTSEPVDLSAYTIKILNGSGVTGEAGKLKTQLIDDGFKVGSTGNADLSDYTKTQVVANSNVSKAYLEKLTAELSKTYVVDSSAPSGTTSQGADVTITIGSETAK